MLSSFSKSGPIFLITARLKTIDWYLIFATLPVSGAGLLTMNSFAGESQFYEKQIIWLLFSVAIFFVLSFIDFRFLRRTDVVVIIFGLSVALLSLLLLKGEAIKGARSWFDLGQLSFQPVDLAKLSLILLLAKYFSRRHIEIAHFRHIIVSGLYASLFFFLTLLQPDFGSAIIIFLIWLGMVLVSGISKKHLLLVFLGGLLAAVVFWFFVFEDYQRQRVFTFINPLTDVRGAGYNAYQSTIAVGAGGILGKGVGYGTQSRLNFLPEYQTDFIFAAFAEEWGFVGVILLFGLYAVVLWRILINASRGPSNFEILFGIGVAILFLSHLTINIGMNIGLLPITGTTIPLMSYGGSHLLAEFAALGVIMGMQRYQRAAHKDAVKNEFLGPA